MTREEAVNELNDRIKVAEYVNSDYIDCVSVDAVKMAISALSVPDTNVGDMISRQAAKLKVARVIWEDGESFNDFHDKCVDCLDNVPSAQRTGRWIVKRDSIGCMYGRCTSCGMKQYAGRTKFCPNCGARMEEQE